VRRAQAAAGTRLEENAVGRRKDRVENFLAKLCQRRNRVHRSTSSQNRAPERFAGRQAASGTSSERGGGCARATRHRAGRGAQHRSHEQHLLGELGSSLGFLQQDIAGEGFHVVRLLLAEQVEAMPPRCLGFLKAAKPGAEHAALSGQADTRDGRRVRRVCARGEGAVGASLPSPLPPSEQPRQAKRAAKRMGASRLCCSSSAAGAARCSPQTYLCRTSAPAPVATN